MRINRDAHYQANDLGLVGRRYFKIPTRRDGRDLKKEKDDYIIDLALSYQSADLSGSRDRNRARFAVAINST